MNNLYGIDDTKDTLTPREVRDALIQCFFEAHCTDTGLGDDEKERDDEQLYCKTIVEKMFNETGGNFDNPSKEDLLNVVDKLKEFSKDFRDPSIIEKHASEVLSLIQKVA